MILAISSFEQKLAVHPLIKTTAKRRPPKVSMRLVDFFKIVVSDLFEKTLQGVATFFKLVDLIIVSGNNYIVDGFVGVEGFMQNGFDLSLDPVTNYGDTDSFRNRDANS
jgi:hypothetical protein